MPKVAITTPASKGPAMRDTLIECAHFDWSAISPAIFGSMFQSVMLPEERHEIGGHYTTEENILKALRPLFLDEDKHRWISTQIVSGFEFEAPVSSLERKTPE